MVTTTGTYEGKTVQVTWSIVSPYTASATDELIQGYGGADVIYGNALDNFLFGDQRGDRSDFDPTADGADLLYGYGGDDMIDPGAGFGNYVDGGAEIDTLDYRYATPGQALTIDMELGTATAGTYGSTTFVGIENVFGSLNGPNVISGDANDNEIHGGAFADELRGRDGKDLLVGNEGDDELRGGAGADLLQGGIGEDLLVASRGADKLNGGKDNDRLEGGRGGDRLIGGDGKDRLLGEQGNDDLEGRGGKDVLIGGRGADKLSGGRGADKFVFYKDSDYNKITDFESKDLIRIGSGATQYSQLDFTDTKSGLRIEFGNVEIFLKGLDKNDIDAGNFDFF